MKQTMKLSEKEARILRDVCYARMKALKAGDPQNVEDMPVHAELDEHLVRQCLIVFDFFRCAMAGNETAVKKQAATERKGECVRRLVR